MLIIWATYTMIPTRTYVGGSILVPWGMIYEIHVERYTRYLVFDIMPYDTHTHTPGVRTQSTAVVPVYDIRTWYLGYGGYYLVRLIRYERCFDGIRYIRTTTSVKVQSAR